jgi:hypothetical protein
MSMTDGAAGNSLWWRLAHTLSVVDASLLALGLEPLLHSSNVERFQEDYQPLGYRALKLSILHALSRVDLPGQLIEWDGSISFDYPFESTVCDPAQSYVHQGPLFTWLKSKGCSTGLLVPDDGKLLGIKDKSLRDMLRSWQQL